MSWVYYLSIYLIGLLILLSATRAFFSVMDSKKVKSFGDFLNDDLGIALIPAVLWPLVILLLPFVGLTGIVYLLFRIFQWIGFGIFKAKENI